jgi:hypothetical protein
MIHEPDPVRMIRQDVPHAFPMLDGVDRTKRSTGHCSKFVWDHEVNLRLILVELVFPCVPGIPHVSPASYFEDDGDIP